MGMDFFKFSIDALFKSFYTCIIICSSLYSLTKGIHFFERLLLLLLSTLKIGGMKVFLNMFKGKG